MTIDEDAMIFVAAFAGIQQRTHAVSKENGWWDHDVPDGVRIALMHSELSEALEALREGDPPSKKLPGFTAEEEELGDVIIRIMDHAERKGLRIGEAIIGKIAFNKTRPHRHGGKAF